MYRIGFGYDVHKIEKPLKTSDTHVVLCGVSVPCEYIVIAHSDGDVALHALVDALLGAACIEGANDIGMLFPDTDEKWSGKSSSYFLEHVVTLIQRAGYMVNNADLTIVCETPRIQQYRNKMQQKVADLLCTRKDQVNVKATTTEKLGPEGRKEGISAYAIVSLAGKKP
ncbi:2-C-methyl-D-erythritol 2,4-cyclodiphosphate synthase [Neorickettsia findlayensis]|uniref:2-C-methyl-D-erythritol 2,4-cyclodiphosphate synthase n=1 Tax=Neorickettsia findlayensis TaxID=2686014 RepID=A0A6P1G9B8_9RICK|nr:2-C-methyl-D-erythritol 2,4-cyclodiphosphate synthase [Neorickettsia findlayensis]QHD64955.1 2-C-methyl-D-erythritol 2,4-cyclodiphosphate synthase [Neorickettsia findlayensis]